VSITGVVSR
jgi:hypothetical protein